MSGEIDRIIDHIENVYTGYCWTDQNYFDLLKRLSPEYVNVKVDGFSNTIHQLCRHLLATEDLVIKRLKGIPYELSEEENFPSQSILDNIPWETTIAAIHNSKNQLVEALHLLKDENLDQPPFPGFSKNYIQIHGLIEHLHYHMGQMSLIHKLLEKRACI